MKGHVSSETQNLSCRIFLTFSGLTWPLRDLVSPTQPVDLTWPNPQFFYFFFDTLILGRVIKHLEELTQRQRDIDDCLEDSIPKATAGEMDDIVYEPTDDEHEEPAGRAEPGDESHEKSAEPAAEDVEAPPASDPGAADDPEGLIEVDV